MQKTKKSLHTILGWTGIALCALCCTLPVIGTAIGLASLTAISVYAEKVGIMALGLAVFFFWYAWYQRNKKSKKASACDIDCNCKPEPSPQGK